jgi:hypothetical protein
MIIAMCSAALNMDTGGTCYSDCFCSQCPVQALKCLGDPKCKAIVDCGNEKMCDATSCFAQENCLGVITDGGGTAVAEALAFAPCGTKCVAMCPTAEAGPDAPTEAAPDAPSETTTDAPATDTSSDAPAASDGAEGG